LNWLLHACQAGAWATSPVHFALVIVERVSWANCPIWPWTLIFLISAS
jgi:hypothetical protein